MKRVIIDILKGYKWQILLLTALLGVNIYLLMCPPKIIGDIIDMLYNLDINRENIVNSIIYLIVVCILYFIVRIIWKYFEVVVARGIEKRITVKTFEKFLKLKIKDIQAIKNGEIMSYFVKDINEIRSTAYRIISHGARIFFTIAMAIYQMANGVNLYLTVAVLIPILVSGYLVVKIKKYIEISFKKSQEVFTEMSEYIQESTDSIRTTKAYSCEGKQLKDFIRKNRRVRQSNNIVDVYSNLLKISLNVCFGTSYRNLFAIWLKVSFESEKLQLEN